MLDKIVKSECRHFTTKEWKQASAELAAMQARIEKLETENERLNKIIHAVDVAARRRLKMNEDVWDIISDIRSALESA